VKKAKYKKQQKTMAHDANLIKKQGPPHRGSPSNSIQKKELRAR
jgi:hypothetical protein